MILQHAEFKFCRASWVGGHDSIHLELAGFEGLHGWGGHDSIHLHFLSGFEGLHVIDVGDMIALIWHFQVLKGFTGGGDMVALIWNFHVLKGFMGGVDMIAFISNFHVLKGFMGGGGHDRVHLELASVQGHHGVISRDDFKLGPS